MNNKSHINFPGSLKNGTWHRGSWPNIGFIQSYVIVLYKIRNEHRIPFFWKITLCWTKSRDLYRTSPAFLSLKLVRMGITEMYPHPQYNGKQLDYFLTILSNRLKAFNGLQTILPLYLSISKINQVFFFFP